MIIQGSYSKPLLLTKLCEAALGVVRCAAVRYVERLCKNIVNALHAVPEAKAVGL